MSDSDLLPRISDENYKEFIKAPAALILFKISSCQQCEEFEPIVESLVLVYRERIQFGKGLLHIPGLCRAIKREHRFESFPTTHFYKAGNLVHTLEGKVSLGELDGYLKEHLL